MLGALSLNVGTSFLNRLLQTTPCSNTQAKGASMTSPHSEPTRIVRLSSLSLNPNDAAYRHRRSSWLPSSAST